MLTDLFELELNDNKITNLDPSLVKLTKLAHLDISRNKITELHPCIDKLINLEGL